MFYGISAQLQWPCANDLQLQRCSERSCFRFCALSFEGLLLVYISYSLRFVTTDLLFISKILVFEIENYQQHHIIMLLLFEITQNMVCLSLSNLKVSLFWVVLVNICVAYLQIHYRKLSRNISIPPSKDVKRVML